MTISRIKAARIALRGAVADRLRRCPRWASRTRPNRCCRRASTSRRRPPAPRPAPAPAARRRLAPLRPAPRRCRACCADGDDTAQSQPTAQDAGVAPSTLSRYELPDFATLARSGRRARRGQSAVPGATPSGTPTAGAIVGADARLDAPMASRWASIALRARAAVAARHAAPDVNGADFAAERALAAAAHGRGRSRRAPWCRTSTPSNYTPELYPGGDAGLARAPAIRRALPARRTGIAVVSSNAAGRWPGRCARGFAGEPNDGGPAIDQARRRGSARPAISTICWPRRSLGTGAQGRRAVTIEWDGVDRLTAWRWGWPTATGGRDRRPLCSARAGPQVRYWRALAPTGPHPAQRAPAVETGRRGAGRVLERGAGRSLWRDRRQRRGRQRRTELPRAMLRVAYTAAMSRDRMTALRSAVGRAPTAPRARYARLVLTARARRRHSRPSAERCRGCPTAGRGDAHRRAMRRRAMRGGAAVVGAAAAMAGRCSRSAMPARAGTVCLRRFRRPIGAAGAARRRAVACRRLGRSRPALDAERGAQRAPAIDVRISAPQNAWTQRDRRGRRGAAIAGRVVACSPRPACRRGSGSV